MLASLSGGEELGCMKYSVISPDDAVSGRLSGKHCIGSLLDPGKMGSDERTAKAIKHQIFSQSLYLLRDIIQ